MECIDSCQTAFGPSIIQLVYSQCYDFKESSFNASVSWRGNMFKNGSDGSIPAQWNFIAEDQISKHKLSMVWWIKIGNNKSYDWVKSWDSLSPIFGVVDHQ